MLLGHPRPPQRSHSGILLAAYSEDATLAFRTRPSPLLPPAGAGGSEFVQIRSYVRAAAARAAPTWVDAPAWVAPDRPWAAPETAEKASCATHGEALPWLAPAWAVPIAPEAAARARTASACAAAPAWAAPARPWVTREAAAWAAARVAQAQVARPGAAHLISCDAVSVFLGAAYI